MGCVPPTNVAFGTDEEFEDLCKQSIDAMAKGGGFVLAPGCEYPANAAYNHATSHVQSCK
ncbi:MAG: hypothetical protein V8R80_08970 [Eubacterium sp.]